MTISAPRSLISDTIPAKSQEAGTKCLCQVENEDCLVKAAGSSKIR